MKLQLYIKPARAASLFELGRALDKWEALGRELGRTVADDFKLLALKGLMPKSMVDLAAAQPALKTFRPAFAYVQGQIAAHRHASQVSEVQRQARDGPAPMDIGAVIAAIERLRGEPVNGANTDFTHSSDGHGHNCEHDHGGSSVSGVDVDVNDLVSTVVAALQGKGKGNGVEGK